MATGDWLVFVDADSHPSAELLADVAEQMLGGRCLAGGATIRLPRLERTSPPTNGPGDSPNGRVRSGRGAPAIKTPPGPKP